MWFIKNSWQMFATASGAIKIGKKSSTLDRDQALDSVPVKNESVTCMRLESGEVMLSHPVGMRPFITHLMRTLGGPADYVRTKKLQLDALGTSVWDAIDGRRTVRMLIKQFAAHHKLHPREAELSVSRFLRELGKRGIIGLK